MKYQDGRLSHASPGGSAYTVLQSVMIYGKKAYVDWVPISCKSYRICVPHQCWLSKACQVTKYIVWISIVMTLIHLNKTRIFNRNHIRNSLVSFFWIIKQKCIKVYLPETGISIYNYQNWLQLNLHMPMQDLEVIRILSRRNIMTILVCHLQSNFVFDTKPI